MSDLTHTLADRVVKLRAQKGLSCNRLAELAEVDQSNLSKMEGGKKAFTDSVLKAIAPHLGVPLAELKAWAALEGQDEAVRVEMAKELLSDAEVFERAASSILEAKERVQLHRERKERIDSELAALQAEEQALRRKARTPEEEERLRQVSHAIAVRSVDSRYAPRDVAEAEQRLARESAVTSEMDPVEQHAREILATLKPEEIRALRQLPADRLRQLLARLGTPE
jgi:transcriptional regulator with XRE-family HTH domain